MAAGLWMAIRTDSRHATPLHTVAKARHWYQQLTTRAQPLLAAIARAEGVTRSYAVRLFPYALLAPDLMQELIDGTAPPTVDRTIQARSGPCLVVASQAKIPKLSANWGAGEVGRKHTKKRSKRPIDRPCGEQALLGIPPCCAVVA